MSNSTNPKPKGNKSHSRQVRTFPERRRLLVQEMQKDREALLKLIFGQKKPKK